MHTASGWSFGVAALVVECRNVYWIDSGPVAPLGIQPALVWHLWDNFRKLLGLKFNYIDFFITCGSLFKNFKISPKMYKCMWIYYLMYSLAAFIVNHFRPFHRWILTRINVIVDAHDCLRAHASIQEMQ